MEILTWYEMESNPMVLIGSVLVGFDIGIPV